MLAAVGAERMLWPAVELPPENDDSKASLAEAVQSLLLEEWAALSGGALMLQSAVSELESSRSALAPATTQQRDEQHARMIATLKARHRVPPYVDLAALVEARARNHWRAGKFYRQLGAMLFAAEPAQRWRIFEHFYRLPAPLIERFYAGKATLADKARMLIGRPPMPIPRALAALSTAGAPLGATA